jgi:hypothetical protein
MTPHEYVERLLVCAQKIKSDSVEFIENYLGVEKGSEEALRIYADLNKDDELIVNALIKYCVKKELVLIDLTNATYLARKNFALEFMYFVRFEQELPMLEDIPEMFKDTPRI